MLDVQKYASSKKCIMRSEWERNRFGGKQKKSSDDTIRMAKPKPVLGLRAMVLTTRTRNKLRGKGPLAMQYTKVQCFIRFSLEIHFVIISLFRETQIGT